MGLSSRAWMAKCQCRCRRSLNVTRFLIIGKRYRLLRQRLITLIWSLSCLWYPHWILLLLGRDIIRAHKVRSQVNGPHDAPYAQCLDLGWVIIGDVCLIGAHKPTVNSFKTSIFENGRPSFLIPCENRIHLMERFTNTCSPFEKTQTKDDVGKLIFKQTVDDDNSRWCYHDIQKNFTKMRPIIGWLRSLFGPLGSVCQTTEVKRSAVWCLSVGHLKRTQRWKIIM